MKKFIKNLFKTLLIICIVAVSVILIINIYVRLSAKSKIITANEAKKKTDVDCILVLGCGVYANGTPSPMLRDRLDIAIDEYDRGATPKLLMSGNHGDVYYNEVSAMKKYAMNNGVTDSDDIFMTMLDSRRTKAFTVPKRCLELRKLSLYQAPII